MLSALIAAIAAVFPFATWKQAQGFAFLVGPEYVHQNLDAPQIIWIPNKDTIQSPQLMGTNPPPIRGRVAGALINAWGPDYDTTEAMVFGPTGLLATFEAVIPANWEVDEGEWLNPQDATLVKGRGYVFQARFLIPVVGPTAETIQLVAGTPGPNQANIVPTFQMQPGAEHP
jgi:hypothetical protein